MLALLTLALLAQADVASGSMDSPIVSSAPLTTSGHIPQCLGDPTCLLQATPLPDAGCSAITGSGRTLPCTCGAGATVAVVAYQGPNQTLPRYAWTNISDTSACSIAAGDAADAGLAAAAESAAGLTIQCAVAGGSNSSNVALAYGNGASGSGSLYVNAKPAEWLCAYGGTNPDGGSGGQAAASVAVGSGGAWVSGSCLFGQSTLTARANGSVGTPVALYRAGAPTTQNLYFGRYANTGSALTGALGHCTMWGNARAASDLTRDEARWFGGLAETRNVTTTRASSGCWETGADAGPMVKCVGVNAGRVDQRGELSYSGEANALAQSTGYDTAATWVPVGLVGAAVDAGMVPVVTANSTDVTDPLGGYASEKVVFHETLNEGDTSILQQGFTGTAAAWSGSNVFFRTGSGTATLYLYAYTGSAAPPANALATCSVTTTWAPCAWLGATLSAATYQFSLGVDLRATIGTGQAAKAAQTVYVWGAKAARGSVAGPPILCGSAPCSSASDVHTMPSAGLPKTSGRVTFTYRPMNTMTNLSNYYYLLDARSPTDGIYIYYVWGTADRQLVVSTKAGEAYAIASSAALTITGGVDQQIEVVWGNGNIWLRRDGAVVASIVNGTAKMPTGFGANIAYGNNIGGAYPANGWVSKPQWSRQ